MHLLKTETITVQYGPNSPVIKFPDIIVQPQEKILLLGDSGCGKTSLLSVIAGLLKPKTGSVFVQGTDIYKMNTKERDHLRGQKFGFVFQTLHLLPSLSIDQNIRLAADMAGVNVEGDRMHDLLSSLGLSQKQHAKPHELSQGQQQRAALARSLYHAPALVIADEPTSALDDRHANAVIDLLEKQTRESHSALLVATHDHRIKGRFDKVIELSAILYKEVA